MVGVLFVRWSVIGLPFGRWSAVNFWFGRCGRWSVLCIFTGRWSVAHGRWSVVGGWSVGGGFVLRPLSVPHVVNWFVPRVCIVLLTDDVSINISCENHLMEIIY